MTFWVLTFIAEMLEVKVFYFIIIIRKQPGYLVYF